MRVLSAWKMFEDYEKADFNPGCSGVASFGGRGFIPAGGGYSRANAAYRTYNRRQPLSRLMKKLLPLSLVLTAGLAHAQVEQPVQDIDPDAQRRAQIFREDNRAWSQANVQRDASGPPKSLTLTPLLTEEIGEKFQLDPQIDPVEESVETEADSVEEDISLVAEDVFVAQLSDWDIAGVGILTPELGGLSSDLWENTSVEEAIVALKALPPQISSLALRNMVQQLLLSAVQPPEDSVGRGWELIEARLQALRQMGDVNNLAALLDALPALQAPAELASLRANAYLMAGDFASACTVVEQQLADDANAYWTEMSIACRAMDGDMAGARLSLDAFREQSDVDPFFSTLIEGLFSTQIASVNEVENLGAASDWPEDVSVVPLYFALAQAQGRVLPYQQVAENPSLSAAYARSAAHTPAERLAAAEVAVAKGLVGAETLSAIALSLPLAYQAPEDLGLDEEAVGRVRAYQAAVAVSDPGLKLAALRDLWRVAEEQGLYTSWALASADIAKTIEPAPDLVEAAPEVVRVLALAGESDRVIDWYRFVRASSSPAVVGPQAAAVGTQALLQLWPLALIHDEVGQVPLSPRILELWWQAEQSRGATTSKAQRLFSILEALGLEVPAESWVLLSDATGDFALPELAPAAHVDLTLALEKGQTGLAMLHAATLLGSTDVGGHSADDISVVIRALMVLSQETEARALASEIALAP